MWKYLQHSKRGIRFNQVSTFYPSSKLCSCCGYKNVNLKLSDRIFNCPSCGLSIDRDLNAGLNLKYLGLTGEFTPKLYIQVSRLGF